MRAIDCLQLQEGVCYFTDEARVYTRVSTCVYVQRVHQRLLAFMNTVGRET